MAGSGIQISLFGDWRKAERILQVGQNKMKICMKRALKQEGQFLRKLIIRGIRKQAPGGKKFNKLQQTTLATRKFQNFRGRKALVRAGDLIQSITVLSKSDGVFIGVLKTKRAKTGRAMVNVAKLQEFGSRPIVIKVTRKMQRFLFAAFKARRSTRSGKANPSAPGVIIIRVPKRPFLQPIFDQERPKIGPRVIDRMAICLGKMYGPPRRRPPK